MMPDLISEASVYCIFFGGFFMLISVGGWIVDYLLPHVPVIQRHFDRLFGCEDDEELCQQERVCIRKNRKSHKNRRNVR